MTIDASQPPDQPGMEPAASLTSVRVKRRKSQVSPSGKRGDLTDQAEAPAAEPAPAPAPETTVSAQAIQEALESAQEKPAPEPKTPAPQPEAPVAVKPPAAPVVVQPPPTLPEPEEREAVLPLVDVLLPELAKVLKEGERREPIAPSLEAPAPKRGKAPRQPEPRLAAAPGPEEEPAGPSDTVIPLPVPQAPAGPGAEPPRAAAAGVNGAAATPDILDYWDGLRGTRDFPSLNDLDRAHVARWPNTILLAFTNVEMPSITRIGENNGEIEYTAMVTDWILSRGRNSAKRAEPMEEEQRFPVSAGSARYRLLLLPISGNGPKCDHVLCHLTRAQDLSAVASFKRWLAS